MNFLVIIISVIIISKIQVIVITKILKTRTEKIQAKACRFTKRSSWNKSEERKEEAQAIKGLQGFTRRSRAVRYSLLVMKNEAAKRLYRGRIERYTKQKSKDKAETKINENLGLNIF